MPTFDIPRGQVWLDEEDVPILATEKWQMHRSGYAVAWTDAGKFVMLHRVLLAAPKGLDVDHINGQRADNRRENLRLCSRAENARNQRTRSNSTTGVRGVHFCQREKRYVAMITRNYKKYWLGYFDQIEDAAQAYMTASAKFHGDFGAAGPKEDIFA